MSSPHDGLPPTSASANASSKDLRPGRVRSRIGVDVIPPSGRAAAGLGRRMLRILAGSGRQERGKSAGRYDDYRVPRVADPRQGCPENRGLPAGIRGFLNECP